MKQQKSLGIIILIILVSFVCSITTFNNVFADTAVPETSEVYEKAPKGMKLENYIDIIGSFKNTYTNKDGLENSAKLITGYPTDIVQMMSEDHNGTTQLSSFWGKIKTDDGGNKTYNYWDLSKEQEISAWIYNGNSSTNRTDGFSFVLQNDSLGTDAISRMKGKPKAGQTLGVWGGATTDNGTTIAATETVYGYAIQNSFAIEFDSQLNKDIPTKSTDGAESFDMVKKSETYEGDLKNPHIAWGYPGDSGTYTPHLFLEDLGSGTDTKFYYQELNHNTLALYPFMVGYDGEEQTPLDPASAWRHFSIKYTPPTSGSMATIQYKFNDKYPDGTSKVPGAVDGRKFEINIDKFKSKDNKIRWGFTAANGSRNSVNQDIGIIMEEMPAIVDVNVDSILYDLTNDTKSTDMDFTVGDNGVKVYDSLPTNDGDKLKLKYSLDYVGGIDSSGEITTKMVLPEHVDYKADDDGNIGLITYHDKDGNVTKEENISQSQLEMMTTTIPGETPTYKDILGLNLKIDSLEDIGSYVTIEVYGNAEAPSSETLQVTDVSSEHTSYKSDNYNGDIMSPAFTISNEKLKIEANNDLNQTLTVDDSLKLNGDAYYLRGSTFDGGDVEAEIQVLDSDGKSIGETGKANFNIAKGTTKYTFNIDYPLKDLDSGQTYTFKINLKDAKSRISNTLTYTVQVEDNKALVLEKNNYEGETVIEQDNSLDPLKINTTYDDDSNIGAETLQVYYQVDEQDPITVDEKAGGKTVQLSYDLSELNLSLGTHTLKVYANDGKRNSNSLTYQFKVIDKGLVLTAKEPEINVRNNDPVPLTWNVVYSSEVDGKTANDKVKPVKYLLQVKNEGDSEYRDFYYQTIEGTENVEDKTTPSKLDDDHNFTFEVNPINYLPNDINTKKNASVLKEGENHIKFSVYEGNYHSNEVNITINVPKLTSKLTATEPDIYFRGKSSMLRIPLKYEYLEDSEYDSRLGLQTTTYVTDTGRELIMAPYGIADDFRSFESVGNVALLNLDWSTGDDHTVTASTKDPYNRTTNSVEIRLHKINKFLELEVHDASFNDIDYKQAENDLIGRQGDWDVTVKNVGAKWNLYAQSEGLYNLRDEKYFKDLVFVDPESNSLELSQKQKIASRTSIISTGQPKLENVASDWDDDKGILVRNNKPDIAGEYQGTIDWTLEDVIE